MTDIHPPQTPGPDPTTLDLRGRPPRAIRFRRNRIIALAATASAFVVGAAWLSLRPAGPILGTVDRERAQAVARPPDLLAAAPSTYEEVPRLGPPLPGDLGRPILERQRALADDMGTSSTDDELRAVQAAEAERQRVETEQRAARESAVMMQLARTATMPPTAPTAASQAAVAAPADAGQRASPTSLSEDPNRQQRKIGLVGRANAGDDLNPHSLVAPPSPYVLGAGSVIAASLITGINSDLPGLVTAQVTENAYDSVTGRTLLIPQGSRLIGTYDSVVAFGQNRALLVWERIILPDGSSIRIDNVPASDTAGQAGLSDRVDRHSWQLLRGVVLSTLLGVGTDIGIGSSEGDLVRALRQSAQQNGARAGDQLVARSLDVQPTIRVRPGWPLRVVVNKDIVLRPWRRPND